MPELMSRRDVAPRRSSAAELVKPTSGRQGTADNISGRRAVVKRSLVGEKAFAQREVCKRGVIRINPTGDDEVKGLGREMKGLLNGLG